MAPRTPLPAVLPALALAAAISCSAPVVAADAPLLIYSCTVNGHVFTGSEPPPECRNVELRILNPDGSQKTVIPRPLNREERKKRAEEEEAKRKQEEEAHKQENADKRLLETYGSVSEIEAARVRAIAPMKIQIQQADARIAQHMREKKRLDEEAEFYSKREMPIKLKDAFDANQALTDQQEKIKSDVNRNIDATNEKYERDKRRFAELEKAAMEAQAAREKAAAERERMLDQTPDASTTPR
jgi:hypothetical protein